VVSSAVKTLRATGIEVDEVELDFKAGHDTLAGLWVRVISVHYAAIARHWKDEGIDLLGASSISADDARRTEDFCGRSRARRCVANRSL
jgi:hypothetical protein